MAELGRTYIKDALNRAIAANEGARLIGATLAGTAVTHVQGAIEALKTLVDQKLDSNHTSVTNTRTPTDATVTNAKVAQDAAIQESKLSLASDAAANTASRRTLGNGAQQAAAGNDSRLSDTRTPTDATVTNAKVAGGAGIEEAKLNLASDAAPGTASRRTLGNGAQQAAAGNDSRLSDTRTPTDATVTNAKVAANAAIDEGKLNLASDAAAGTASRRTLGNGAQQAAAGNDGRLSDTRTPTNNTVAIASHVAATGPWVRVANSAARAALGLVRQGQIVYQADTQIYYKNTSPDGTDAASATWLDMAPAGGSIPAAGEAQVGVLRLATQPEADAGALDNVALTPAKVAALTREKMRFGLTNPTLATEGELAYDNARKSLKFHDGTRAKGLVSGYAPYAFQIGGGSAIAQTTAANVAASGGAIMIPMNVPSHMLVDSVTFWNTDAATARRASFALYEDQRNNDGFMTLQGQGFIVAYTPTVASAREMPVTNGPIYLSPGVTWLCIKTENVNTLGIGSSAVGTLVLPTAQTKLIGLNAFPDSIDGATGWTKTTAQYAVRLNGRMFAQAVKF